MQSSTEKAYQLFCFLFIILYLQKHVCCIKVGTKNTSLVSNVSISANANPFISTRSLLVETTSKLSSALPTIPPGQTKFGTGKIDLGGLEVIQVSISTTTSRKVWVTNKGGQDNMGFTVYQPINLPPNFSTLGFYAQANNRKLFGFVLAARDVSGSSLKPPVDYSLVGITYSEDNINAFYWLPLCPNGYAAVGLYVTTTSPSKPGQESISCVVSKLTEQIEGETWLWGYDGQVVYTLRPKNRGATSAGVYTGTFTFLQPNAPPPALFCLKHAKFDLSYMPSKNQANVLFESYAPLVYMHPDETFLPSSVNWFFSNGALLYQKGNEANPVPIKPDGSNLPQGGSEDDLFWLDYPVDKAAKEKVKRGDLGSAKAYLHIKPMFGGTFTDIAVWIFYPFNGNARLKFLFLDEISLGDVGEHIGDWEHVTLRISNFNKELWRVYLGQHSKGTLVEACDLEYKAGGKKPVIYSSLHGHAMFSKPGLVLQGKDGNGIRNDMDKSNKLFDTGASYEVISGPGAPKIPWVNYYRKWGPIVKHDIKKNLDGIAKTLPSFIRKKFRHFIDSLPAEVLGEEGPTGPKVKESWVYDE